MRWLAGLLAVSYAFCAFADFRPFLINGNPVAPGTFEEIVRIRVGNSGCTATIVGPRAIVTAAHCGNRNQTAKFTYKGREYAALLHPSRFYPSKDHDVSVGVTKEDIEGAMPFSIGGEAKIGDELHLFGYGCIKPPGTGGNDGILREGKTRITSFSRYDTVSSIETGVAVCFGDSGGPAFTEVDGEMRLLGINSKGDIEKTSYNTRWDMADSKRFLDRITKEQKIEICGFNKECD